MRKSFHFRRINAKENTAFTLLELLAVVTIIAILAALLLPVGRRMFEQARSSGCLAKMRSVHAILLSYANDHNGYFPKIYNYGATTLWADELAEAGYIPAAMVAPSAADSIFFCPSSTVRLGAGRYKNWYVGNFGLNAEVAGSGGLTPTLGPQPGVPLARISRMSSTLLIFDSGCYGLFNGHVLHPKVSVFYVPGAERNANVSWPEYNKVDAVSGRHSGKIHGLFVDGHVETKTATEFEETFYWDPSIPKP